MALRFGSLFAGIGGDTLGLERAGMRCVWQVEIDPYCQRVLARHWPNVRRHDDVRTFPEIPDDGTWCDGDNWPWTTDVICGGFPCQDISRAGRRGGIHGSKSGLWGAFASVVDYLRPRIAIVENTPSLLARGMDRVLGDLSQSGYDAEWDCLPAASFGAPHIRDRLFIVAIRTDSIRNKVLHDAMRGRYRTPQKAIFAGRRGIELSDWWASEPELGRVANGIPTGMDANRRDRCRVLGNACVPQVMEMIGRRIIELYDPMAPFVTAKNR